MRRVVLLLLSAACTTVERGTVHAGTLEVHGAFAFAPPTTSEAAGYFTVVNGGSQPDTLLGITSPIADGAMLHGQVPDGGMVRMEALGAPVILPGDSLVLAPGAAHLMLMTLARRPAPGDSIAIHLRFAHAGEVEVILPVRAYSDAP